MKRRSAILIVAALVATFLGAGAAPADAAAPRCTGEGERMAWDGRNFTGWTIYFPAHSPDQVVYGIPNTPGTELGTGFWACSLVQGSTGWGVYKLQVAMNICYAGVIGTQLQQDGEFGPRTKAALVKVQQSHQIESNGQYGPQTARTMRHVIQQWHTGTVSCSTLGAAGYPGDSGGGPPIN